MENGIKNYLDNYLDYIMFEKKDCILKLKQDNNNICYKLKEETEDYELYEKTDKKNLNFNKNVIISIDRGVRNKFRKIKNKTESLISHNKPLNANSQKYINQLLPLINNILPKNQNKHLTRPPPKNEPITNFPNGKFKINQKKYSPVSIPREQTRFYKSYTNRILQEVKPVSNKSIDILSSTLFILGKGVKLLGDQLQKKYNEYESKYQQYQVEQQRKDERRQMKQYEKELKKQLEKKINEARRVANDFLKGITPRKGGENLFSFKKFIKSDFYLLIINNQPKYIIKLKQNLKNKVNKEKQQQENQQEKQQQENIRQHFYKINWYLIKIIWLNYYYREFYQFYYQSKLNNQEDKILTIDSIFEEVLAKLGILINGIIKENYQDLVSFNNEVKLFEINLDSFIIQFLTDLRKQNTSLTGESRKLATQGVQKIQSWMGQQPSINLRSNQQKINISKLSTLYQDFKNINNKISLPPEIKTIDQLIYLMQHNITLIIPQEASYPQEKQLYVLGGSN